MGGRSHSTGVDGPGFGVVPVNLPAGRVLPCPLTGRSPAAQSALTDLFRVSGMTGNGPDREDYPLRHQRRRA